MNDKIDKAKLVGYLEDFKSADSKIRWTLKYLIDKINSGEFDCEAVKNECDEMLKSSNGKIKCLLTHNKCVGKDCCLKN